MENMVSNSGPQVTHSKKRYPRIQIFIFYFRFFSKIADFSIENWINKLKIGIAYSFVPNE